jgi:acetylornithine deacetylase/succinyl-diaminopimelate desuccinylase-like protein
VGAQFMADAHFDAIDSRFPASPKVAASCVAAARCGRPTSASTEKEPRFIELIVTGPAGHGSVPNQGSAVLGVASAIGKIGAWTPPLRLNETTASYFRKLSTIVEPEVAQKYRDLLSPDPKVHKPVEDWMLVNEPAHWSMTHTSLVPTILNSGFRYNVIPSEAKATIDVRLHPDETREVPRHGAPGRQRPAGRGALSRERYRPAGASRLNTEAFSVIERMVTKHYDTVTLPTMGTGATDMSNIRAKGPQCYGIGPALDVEDGQ